MRNIKTILVYYKYRDISILQRKQFRVIDKIIYDSLAHIYIMIQSAGYCSNSSVLCNYCRRYHPYAKCHSELLSLDRLYPNVVHNECVNCHRRDPDNVE